MKDESDNYYNSFGVGEVVRIGNLLSHCFGFNKPIYGKITKRVKSNYCFDIISPLGKWQDIHMSDVNKIENNELFYAYFNLGKKHLKLKEKIGKLIQVEE